MLKITGGHQTIFDQFVHMTVQLVLEPVIRSDHSFWGGGCTVVLISMIVIMICMITSNHVDCDNSCLAYSIWNSVQQNQHYDTLSNFPGQAKEK